MSRSRPGGTRRIAKPAVKTTAPEIPHDTPMDASVHTPHVHKSGDNNYKVSEPLLVWTDKICTAAVFIKYHDDHFAATPPRSKGDSYYSDMNGNVIEGVTWFIPIKEIPLPAKKAPEKAPTV